MIDFDFDLFFLCFLCILFGVLYAYFAIIKKLSLKFALIQLPIFIYIGLIIVISFFTELTQGRLLVSEKLSFALPMVAPFFAAFIGAYFSYEYSRIQSLDDKTKEKFENRYLTINMLLSNVNNLWSFIAQIKARHQFEKNELSCPYVSPFSNPSNFDGLEKIENDRNLIDMSPEISAKFSSIIFNKRACFDILKKYTKVHNKAGKIIARFEEENGGQQPNLYKDGQSLFGVPLYQQFENYQIHYIDKIGSLECSLRELHYLITKNMKTMLYNGLESNSLKRQKIDNLNVIQGSAGNLNACDDWEKTYEILAENFRKEHNRRIRIISA